MKRLGYVLIFLLGVATTFAQPTPARGKLAISFTFSPTLRHTTYKPQFLYPNSDGQIVEPVYVSGSRWAPGFMVGPTVEYHYAPGWSVSAGVWYRQQGFRQLRPTGDGTTILRDRILRIPLMINFRQSARRLSPYFTFGTTADITLTGRVLVQRNAGDDQTLRISPERGPYFHILLGAGAQYQLTRELQLTVQPQYAYNLGRFGGYKTHNPSFDVTLLTQVAYRF